MRTYARWLFGSTAALNIVVGLSLLFLRHAIGPLLGLDPVTGTNLFFANLAGTMIALFGYVYARIAIDPVSNRPFIHYTAIGKMLAFVSALVPWLEGEITILIPALVVVDFGYALLFLDYLRRTRALAR